jgi:hypothetical protein
LYLLANPFGGVVIVLLLLDPTRPLAPIFFLLALGVVCAVLPRFLRRLPLVRPSKSFQGQTGAGLTRLKVPNGSRFWKLAQGRGRLALGWTPWLCLFGRQVRGKRPA